MSRLPSDDLDELTVNLGDLSITVRSRGRGRGASSAGGSTPLAGLRAAGQSRNLGSSTAASEDWEVVGSAPWTAAWREQLERAETAADLLAVDLAPVQHLVPQLSARHPEWTPLARLGRALRAGVCARTRLDDFICAAGPSPRTPFPNRIFVVLRGFPGVRPGHTDNAQIYFRAVRGRSPTFHPEAVSHAFATRAEAQAYVLGAGQPWPEQYQEMP